MDELGLDAVVFPAVADVGPADMDVNEASADLGWRNGVWVANGNLVPRHLGIPTVTVPMGTMADIRMPVGLTFAGRAYDDSALLALAAGVRGDRLAPHGAAAHAAARLTGAAERRRGGRRCPPSRRALVGRHGGQSELTAVYTRGRTTLAHERLHTHDLATSQWAALTAAVIQRSCGISSGGGEQASCRP